MTQFSINANSENISLSSQCKLKKSHFVNAVTSCACVLLVLVVFLSKVTSPTTGLACIIQRF